MKRSLNYILFTVAVFVSFACDTGKDGIYGDDTLNDSNAAVDDEITEYMERPDSDNNPGGGGTKTDTDTFVIQDDEKNDDIDMPDSNDETPDETDEGIYSTEPSIGKCESGWVTKSEKELVLERLNYIRSLHDLPPVFYEEDDDTLTAECSLIIAANKQLSHTPDSSWKCFSADAYSGCNKSNIFIQWGGDPLAFPSRSVVDAFMTDENVESLGHRRWFIDPWLSHISFGRVDDTVNKVLGSAIKVINDTEQSIASSSIEYVAYPYEYYPAELYNDNVMLSFTLIYDRNNKWTNNKISFASSAIAITDPSNKTMKISGMKFDNDG
ncbi:MAG TPA: CAP domain-containing protein, partial [bacterium]|nr:CAP domain-containing protein [bacterium]